MQRADEMSSFPEFCAPQTGHFFGLICRCITFDLSPAQRDAWIDLLAMFYLVKGY